MICYLSYNNKTLVHPNMKILLNGLKFVCVPNSLKYMGGSFILGELVLYSPKEQIRSKQKNTVVLSEESNHTNRKCSMVHLFRLYYLQGRHRHFPKRK